MRLVQATEGHCSEIMQWFSTEAELKEWSGPNFRYPFTNTTFIEDLNPSLPGSFTLTSNTSEVLGFGRYYERLGRCHLGRLAVNPKYRGAGLAAVLIRRICEIGVKEIGAVESSLFVLSHNQKAIRAYKKYGFRFSDYPGEIGLENCLYMIKAENSPGS